MKTEDLISALAQDPAPPPPPAPEARLLPGLLAGLMGTLLIYALAYGPRPDLALALSQPVVAAKTVLPLILAVFAAQLALRAARPGQRPGALRWWIWGLPAIAAVLFVVTFRDTAPAMRGMAIRGHSIWVCLPSIPLLSLPLLAGILSALRRGAAVHPVRAGALAGLAAAGLATVVYSTFCIEDTPLFYALWYSAGIGFAAGIGAVAGHLWLRW